MSTVQFSRTRKICRTRRNLFINKKVHVVLICFACLLVCLFGCFSRVRHNFSPVHLALERMFSNSNCTWLSTGLLASELGENCLKGISRPITTFKLCDRARNRTCSANWIDRPHAILLITVLLCCKIFILVRGLDVCSNHIGTVYLNVLFLIITHKVLRLDKYTRWQSKYDFFNTTVYILVKFICSSP